MKNTLPANSSHKPSCWHFGTTTWLVIIGLILLNIGFFLHPFVSVAGGFFADLFSLLDFRTWPFWYFICLVFVVGCSVRWFFLYRKYVNDDLDQLHSEEAQWFCCLSGSITLLLAVLVFLHRFSFLRRIFHPLYLFFGYGDFSYFALFMFAVLLSAIVVVCFFAWKWILTIIDTD
jgi:hypothetical protein